VPHAAIRIGMAPRPGGRSSTNAADTAEAASRPISGKASILLSDEEMKSAADYFVR
jgi:hypothetical protein